VRPEISRARYSCAAVWVLSCVTLLFSAGPVVAQTLAGGEAHTVVLKSDGTVWTFGENGFGQLGNNSTNDSKVPIQVSGLTGVVKVAAGSNHSMALTSAGNLYVWGYNASGQIGDGTTTTPRKTPVQSSLANVVAMAAGANHSVALTSGGDVYTWGKNTVGQLGNGAMSATPTTTPTLVMTGVAAIGTGLDHTLFVKTDGTVYASGENGNGQLGDGTTTDRSTPVQMTGVSGAAAADGGSGHTVILLSNGTMKAAGLNSSGQLGDTTTTQRTTAVAVATVTNITTIASGRLHTLARESDGTVWAWGYNNTGQVGDGTNTNRSSPTEITALPPSADIAAGDDHSVAVTSDGIVHTWGSNEVYQLGDGTTVDRWSPIAISTTGYDWKVATPTFSVEAGTYTLTKTVTVSVATAGATIRYTQNGNEPTESDSSIASGSSVAVNISQTLKAKAFKGGVPSSNTESPHYELKVSAPTASPNTNTFTSTQTFSTSTSTSGATLRYTVSNIQGVPAASPTESSTAYAGSFSVSSYTQITVVGFKSGWSPSDPVTKTLSFNYGPLATPTTDQPTGDYVDHVNVSLSSVAGATIRYTENNTAVQSNSPVYATPLVYDITRTLRFRAYHQDYQPSAEVSRTYTLAPAAPVLNPTSGNYVAGQLVTITASTTGSTLHYTINGTEPTENDPVVTSGGTLIVGNYTLKVKARKTGANLSATTTATYSISGEVTPPAIAAGEEHALAIRSDSIAWAWGRNNEGEVGDGTTSTSPRTFPGIVAGLTGAVAASGSQYHAHALKNDGTLVGWGGPRIGDGTTAQRLMPTVLPGVSAVTAVDGGADHSIALKGDGTVWTWGSNTYGQVGDGTTTTRNSPTAIASLSAVSAVSAGGQFSLALLQDGSVKAWGFNGSGRLGNASTSDSSTPVSVSSLTTATKIAAGHSHALALLADGTVRAWGENALGQLGDGTGVDRTTPVQVAGLENIVAVGAGRAFSVALKDDGTVWTWGGGGDGKLGDGSSTDRSSAAQVPGLADIVQIAVGHQFVLAMTSDATVYAWGNNDKGQLGDGTTTDRSTPVAISGPGMNWRVATPTIDLASGLYSADQAATVTIADPAATLRYTTTGADPTASDATVVSGGTITIAQSQVLKVSGWKSGAPTSVVVARNYELKAVAPGLTPGAGAYGGTQNVAISSTTTGATVRYTIDGSEPIETSATYSAALSVSETVTVKARAYKSGWTPSDTGYASYSIAGGTVATPVITPSGGAHATPPLVAITNTTTGATIRYTLDGSTPTAASPVFIYPFLVHVTTTVKAKAFKAGLNASAVASTTFDRDAAGAVATPAILPAGGRYALQQVVTVTGASGSTLRYTTDGSDPTTASTSITSGGTLAIAKSQVLKVRAWASGLDASAVRRADFVITGALSAGNAHSLALKANGELWAWGDDSFGQIGNGSGITDALSPAQILTGVAAIAAGYRHNVIAKSDGTVWAWGSRTYGRLGTGPGQTDIHSPTQVSGLANAVAAAAGQYHSLVLKSDGTVWAFGRNQYGEVGDGTTTERNTPVQVTGLTGVIAIAAGRDASYALQTDGAGGGIVWAWGNNDHSQLGDGSTLPRSTPVRVLNVPGATAIAAGFDGEFAAALATTGHVWAWGRNEFGAAGNGTTADGVVAAPVSTVARARAIGAGSKFALAIDASALSWGWGNAVSAAAIGDRSSGEARVPERSNFTNVMAFAAGDVHTLALKPNGGVAVAGINAGRYGDGTTSNAANIITVPDFLLADNSWLSTDADADGLDTWREYLFGTDPLNPDTNGNGVMDGLDDRRGTDALDPDVDGDGVPNWIEEQNGTDPFRVDSDGDAVSDLNDAFPLDPTRSMAPSTNPSDTTPPVVTLKAPVSARPIP
jgi:alpha-tubulin suppressor-like RCC1 family protein